MNSVGTRYSRRTTSFLQQSLSQPITRDRASIIGLGFVSVALFAIIITLTVVLYVRLNNVLTAEESQTFQNENKGMFTAALVLEAIGAIFALTTGSLGASMSPKAFYWTPEGISKDIRTSLGKTDGAVASSFIFAASLIYPLAAVVMLYSNVEKIVATKERKDYLKSQVGGLLVALLVLIPVTAVFGIASGAVGADRHNGQLSSEIGGILFLQRR